MIKYKDKFKEFLMLISQNKNYGNMQYKELPKFLIHWHTLEQ
jgi:hypothetical protein